MKLLWNVPRGVGEGMGVCIEYKMGMYEGANRADQN